jgi:hypothetical protein
MHVTTRKERPMDFLTLANLPEAERRAYIAQRAATIVERLRASHARFYPDCTGWRAEPVVSDGWRWTGCGDHAPGTSDGIPSERMVDRACVALRSAD